LGKVKTLLVKRTGRKLLERYPESFADDFKKNEDALRCLGLTPKLRNMIAGQITCEIKKARKEAQREKIKTESAELAAAEGETGEVDSAAGAVAEETVGA